MAEVIVITSGKGGVGKTTTTANIGVGLAKRGKKVVLIDTDTGLRNLDLLLGLERREPEQMKELVAEMKPEFDYILIDCPAGIEQGFQTAVVAADWAIVVTMPEIAAVRDADKIIGRLQNDDKEIKLVVNRIRSQMVKDGTMLDMDAINDILSLPCIGQIPDDEKVIDSANRGEPVIDNASSLAGKAYANVVSRIMGEDVPFLEEPNESFLQRLKKMILGRGKRDD